MRLELQRSGGVVGRTVSWSLDVDALEPGPRVEVEQLLGEAATWQEARQGARQGSRQDAPGGDRLGYRVLADLPGREPVDVRFGEPLPASARRLVDIVRGL